MAEAYKSMEEVLKDGVNIECILEACAEENILCGDDDPLEDDLDNIINNPKLCDELNNNIVKAIAETLKKHGINLGYSYRVFDEEEVHRYLDEELEEKERDVEAVKHHFMVVMDVADRDDVSDALKKLIERGIITISEGGKITLNVRYSKELYK